MAPLCAELRIGLPHHRRSLGSFCLSGPQSPFTLGLYQRALILSHLGSRFCALASYGAWCDRPYVVAARGLTAGLMAGVAMAINGCAECPKKQRKIDRLTEELQRLKQKLRYQERQATKGFFGSATPSAKRPVKTNTLPPTGPRCPPPKPLWQPTDREGDDDALFARHPPGARLRTAGLGPRERGGGLPPHGPRVCRHSGPADPVESFLARRMPLAEHGLCVPCWMFLAIRHCHPQDSTPRTNKLPACRHGGLYGQPPATTGTSPHDSPWHGLCPIGLYGMSYGTPIY
jgi:hypothetical protein